MLRANDWKQLEGALVGGQIKSLLLHPHNTIPSSSWRESVSVRASPISSPGYTGKSKQPSVEHATFCVGSKKNMNFYLLTSAQKKHTRNL